MMMCIHCFSVTEWNGVYDEGTFKTTVAYPYVVAINNVSQFTAMYCLVLFYRANKVRTKTIHTLNAKWLLLNIFIISGGIETDETTSEIFMYQSCCLLLIFVILFYFRYSVDRKTKLIAYFSFAFTVKA